jgi:hypothetical protein
MRIPHRFTELFRKLAFLKGSLLSVAIWPVACLIIGMLMWTGMHAKFREDERSIEASARKEAQILSNAYAQYLTHEIDQIDQLTLLVKNNWERSHRALRLEELLSSLKVRRQTEN